MGRLPARPFVAITVLGRRPRQQARGLVPHLFSSNSMPLGLLSVEPGLYLAESLPATAHVRVSKTHSRSRVSRRRPKPWLLLWLFSSHCFDFFLLLPQHHIIDNVTASVTSNVEAATATAARSSRTISLLVVAGAWASH